MRNRKKTVKLGRSSAHRRSLLANLTCSLIQHGKIRTTLGKAKALRPVAEKMVTLGKRGDLHARRQAIAFLRQKDAVKTLFGDVATAAKDRQGGYCRIVKLGARVSDSAPMAIIEWVDASASDEVVDDDATEAEVEAKPEVEAKTETKPKAKKKAPAKTEPKTETVEA
ncbi:MAG: large subunit ribosomal protein L17 [Rubritalea sp.]|jgi:large subunit ribosomal protein L17